jgi:hypothetical protein
MDSRTERMAPGRVHLREIHRAVPEQLQLHAVLTAVPDARVDDVPVHRRGPYELVNDWNERIHDTVPGKADTSNSVGAVSLRHRRTALNRPSDARARAPGKRHKSVDK